MDMEVYMEKFKVGDRVKHELYEIGIINRIDPIATTFNLCVSFDDGINIFCDGSCLIKFEPEYKTIVINLEGNTVTAYMGKHKAVAKCSPHDDFDLYKGAVLALTRLLVEENNDG